LLLTLGVRLQKLVLIPGLLCTPSVFDSVAPALSSETVRPSLLVSDDLTAIARDLLRVAPETFAVLGMSMGSYLVFEMFRLAPERISAMVLIGASARKDTDEAAEKRHKAVRWAQKVGMDALIATMPGAMLAKQSQQDEKIVTCLADMAEAVGLDAFAAHQAALSRRPDSRATLPDIKCPVLVLTGEEDHVTPAEIAQEIADNVAHGSALHIPGAAHLPVLEQPDPVARHVNQFLQAAGG